MADRDGHGLLMRLPLFLFICGVAAVSMYVPAIYALIRDNHPASQSFFYSGTLGLVCVTMIATAMGGRKSRFGALGQLLAFFATFTVLPLYLAVPFHDALRTTAFENAYFDMVSAITTTGADMFGDPSRLDPVLHLWRAQVGWLGGLLMWIGASAILAPLSLGGFEVTARGEPGRSEELPAQGRAMHPRARLLQVVFALAPLYAGLTGLLWILQMVLGEKALTALCHAMSVMATSGISPVGGLQGAQTGVTGEAVLFLFLFFALSRLTFSNDTVQRGGGRLDRDPEFRVGLFIVLTIPVVLFARHWLASFDIDQGENITLALRALWGAMFTVMSFLTTTGFESADWAEAQQWSGLETPGLILMGLTLIGGGVATTAGGVKLLRVYALYLHGLRELERLVYPNSVSVFRGGNRRIQRDGAFIAWVSFMLLATSLAAVCLALSLLGIGFEQAMILAVATLSTTGPVIELASAAPIQLVELGLGAKAVLCAAMVLGRLETLAIIALFTRDLWRV